ncbi:MAG: histidine ammonia-lyase [Muribaculaceae bacterium]|nr:histidine ammonia-lyase [Muribaculaceae bacterium]MDE6196486.1 histidine ammonia-lyase [Muribaculaceae bacterium]
MNKVHEISTARLSIEEACRIVESGTHIALGEEVRGLISRCREYLDRKIESCSEPVYGITTGFGSLCNISISADDLSQLQSNLVMSHACGVGERVEPEVVKMMLLLKIQSLSYGNSGVQLSTVERLVDFFNNDVLPVVYQQGSLGASGDLAPLANMCLPLLGLGEVLYGGSIRPASEVLAEKGWEPVQLMSKEGLALLNGTQFMSAHGVWAVCRAKRLMKAANRIAAMSLDAFDGRIEPFGPQVNEVRHHPGQIEVAADMRALLEGSELIKRRKEHVQDPYSFRCIPQVHGGVLDTVNYAAAVLEDEINSPTDNPTIFPDDDIIVSAGNFHGEPIALPMDFLAVAMTELSNISERRIYKLIGGTRGLPSFLVAKPGLNSGFMITQYAAASVVNQSKGLCWPTSCDSIPSSQGQEDHVSMGANSATKLLRVVNNTARVLGIELFTAAQALDFRRPARSSATVEGMHADFRKKVPFIDVDTVMTPYIAESVKFVESCCC